MRIKETKIEKVLAETFSKLCTPDEHCYGGNHELGAGGLHLSFAEIEIETEQVVERPATHHDIIQFIRDYNNELPPFLYAKGHVFWQKYPGFHGKSFAAYLGELIKEADTNLVSVSSTDSVQESTPTDCPCKWTEVYNHG